MSPSGVVPSPEGRALQPDVSPPAGQPEKVEPPDWTRAVRAVDPLSAPATDTPFIAAVDQRAANPTRRTTIGDADGPQRPMGQEANPSGFPTLARQEGIPDTRRGGMKPGPDTIAKGRQAGGGERGSGTEAGEPTPIADVGHGSAGRSRTGGSGGGHRIPRGDLATHAWAPLAVRWTPSPKPKSQQTDGELNTPRTGPTIGTRDRRGAPQPAPTLAPAIPTDPAPEAGALPSIVQSPLGDPVADLREALGWGVFDRSVLAPRPAWSGVDGPPAGSQASGSPITSDLPVDYTSAIDARGTPLGKWAERAEARILERWSAVDLPPHERAVGIQGDVSVRYSVDPNGRVSGITVVRSSGLPALDAMAASAIPPRLPRLPRSLGRKAITHKVTLRYRNPLIAPW